MNINIWSNHRIVKGCINGDPEARRVLYEKYSAQMYSVCKRYTKNIDDANDIFQESFYLIYKNISQLRNVEALSGWIKKIFINTAIENSNRIKRFYEVSGPYNKSKEAEYDWNYAISKISTDELTKLIQSLPTGCLTVFNMYVIDGFAHKEIAAKLNISVGTSKSQLHDARKLLKIKIATNYNLSDQKLHFSE